MIRWLASIGLALVSLLPTTSFWSVRQLLASQLISPAAVERSHLISAPPLNWVAEPAKINDQALTLGAASSYAIDLDSAKLLYQHDSSTRRPIASLAKIITVMVILNRHSLEETVTIPALPAYQSDDVTIGLRLGQQFKLRDLVAAALIPSANDAADSLALTDSPSLQAFAVKMNQLASQWGIDDTHFTNPSGLSNDQNLASAEALAKLAKIMLSNSTVVELVAQNNATIQDLSGQSFNLVSSNKILDGKRIIGLKTGFTPAAGQCLVALANIKGHRVITVVLNSPDRFAETTTLVDWIERSYTWN